MHARFGVHQGSEMWTEMTSISPYLRFEKLIGFNIKNLELYINQDSFNKLKGVIYGIGSFGPSGLVCVVSTIVERSPK